jgi:hypothetical protein
MAPDSGVSYYVQYQCGLMRRDTKSTRKNDGIEKLPNYTAKIASLAMIILILANINIEKAQSNVHEKCREGNRNRGIAEASNQGQKESCLYTRKHIKIPS